MRTQAINLLRAQLRQEGYRLGSGSAETAAPRCQGLPLPDALQTTLRPVLELLEHLAPAIAAADQSASRAVATRHPASAWVPP